jgi:hypothetical protein
MVNIKNPISPKLLQRCLGIGFILANMIYEPLGVVGRHNIDRLSEPIVPENIHSFQCHNNSPRLAGPSRAVPLRALPNPAAPCHCLFFILLNHLETYREDFPSPCRAVPGQASPGLTLPSLSPPLQ